MTDMELIDKHIVEAADRMTVYDEKRDLVSDGETRNCFSRLGAINRYLLSIVEVQQRRISHLEDVLQDHLEKNVTRIIERR